MCFNSISILCRTSTAYNVTALKEAPSTKRRAHERRNEKVVMTSAQKRVLMHVNATGLGGGEDRAPSQEKENNKRPTNRTGAVGPERCNISSLGVIGASTGHLSRQKGS